MTEYKRNCPPGVCQVQAPKECICIEEVPSAQAVGSALLDYLNEAEAKAWDSLSRYKFMQFGYWAAIWVHLNRIGNFNRSNPWSSIVMVARERRAQNQ